MSDMKTILSSSIAVLTVLALTATLLPAQNNPANPSSQSGGAVVVGGVTSGGDQSGGAVVINGGGPGGQQSFSFGSSGTNTLDVNAISKAVQDGMKQVFGNQGTNSAFPGGRGFDPSKMMQQFNERFATRMYRPVSDWSKAKDPSSGIESSIGNSLETNPLSGFGSLDRI